MRLADLALPPVTSRESRRGTNAMKRTTAALSVLAGAVLFEAALVPGVLIGAAAMLAPKLLPGSFSKPRRRRPQPPKTTIARFGKSAALLSALPVQNAPSGASAEFPIKRTIFKTITFRVIATSLDFTSNYVIIGELAASAALSAYGLVAGPLFFFLHEMLWHRLGPHDMAANVRVPIRLRSGGKLPLDSGDGFTIHRALAKTITFRSIVTTTDFTANFVVTGNLADAAVLTAFGFVVGPIVYYGHEKAWDRFSPEAPVAPAA
jgi:uncharacterized membrane protein